MLTSTAELAVRKESLQLREPARPSRRQTPAILVVATRWSKVDRRVEENESSLAKDAAQHVLALPRIEAGAHALLFLPHVSPPAGHPPLSYPMIETTSRLPRAPVSGPRVKASSTVRHRLLPSSISL